MSENDTSRIRQILASSPAIIYACRASGDFAVTYVSDNVLPLLGYTPGECLVSNFWRNNLHPDDMAGVLDAYGALLEQGVVAREYRFRRKDGGFVWVLDEARLIRDDDGRPVEIVGTWLDITDRKAAQLSLQKSSELFRAFFDANPIPTIISSLSGVVLMVNPAFTRNPGYAAEEVVGRTVQEMGFWRVPEDRERMVRAIREQGYIDNLESSFFGKGERPMTCLISSRAVEYEGELRILSIVDDVTEQRAIEESQRQLDRAKSDFISTAAHELRTPLVAVIGYCELLATTGASIDEGRKKEYLAIIQSNAEALNRLVDDFLDVGRIQVGRALGIVRRDLDLAAVAARAVDSLRGRSRRHEIVVTHAGGPLPAGMTFDGDRITQVLNNLIGNAIKYSPHGGVIKVQLKGAPDHAEVSVIDQGQGMTAQHVEHIYDRFYRGEFAKPGVSGLGLGMTIVRQIVTEHGGKIAIVSALGEGTTISFTLPVTP